jgi:hypothetical protein
MLKKLIESYRLHLIVMIGTNLAGLINFAFSLILFKIATEHDFNLYSAMSAYLVIVSTPGDLIKKLGTSYGIDIKYTLAKIVKSVNRRNLVITIIAIALALIYFITYTTGASIVSASFLVCAVLVGLYSALLSGLLQNKQEFFYTSIIAIGQSIIKIGVGLTLFKIIGSDGIWITLYFTSMLTALCLQLLTKRMAVKTVAVSNLETKLNYKDLFTNLFLILVLEILLNADSIIAINKLSIDEAYIYNSLSLVRKTMLFSLLGFTAIILSESRKVEVNKMRMLAKNVIITTLIGGGISILFIFAKPFVLDYLKLDNSYSEEYLKFTISSLLFVILLMTTTWFTALKSYSIRIWMGILILSFNIFYYFLFDSISSGIYYQIIGITVILSIQSIIIGYKLSFFRS